MAKKQSFGDKTAGKDKKLIKMEIGKSKMGKKEI